MNMVSISILDIPRAYTALAEWMACMMFVIVYRPSRTWKQVIPISAAALGVQMLFLVFTDDFPLYLWIPCMIVAVGMMFLLLIILCDIDYTAGAYTCVRAFLMAEFAASLEWQIHCFLWPGDNKIWLQRFGLLVLIFAGVFFCFGVMEKRWILQESKLIVSKSELMVVLVLGISIFALSNLSFFFSATPFSSQHTSEVLNIRTLIDTIGVALLYAVHIQHNEIQTRKELSAMQTILDNQYIQYRMSRDSIEMINRKYHDLKHQIAALRAETDIEQCNRWLDEIEEDIRVYEAQNKTGNSVLDIVLTGKNLYCQKHSIDLTIVADGKPLAFMNVMDICTLFGNALDNAIECEKKIEDKSKRMIHMTLATQKQFLLFQVENYCPDMPDMRDGLPATTKEDADYHGFGLKSIQFTAQKYGGTTTVRAEGEWFVLKVLIPLPKESVTNS